MEIKSFFGVPAHPLFVHLPVVLTPLAAFTAVLMFRRDWRKSFLWITVALSGVALLGAQLAVGSGEELEESVNESRALEMHADLGEVTRALIGIFFLVALALAVYEYVRGRRPENEGSGPSVFIATAMTAVMVLSGILATIWVVRAGHQGAKLTWEDVSSEGEE